MVVQNAPEGHRRGDSTFNHVPTNPTTDVSITVQEQPGAVYRLDPYPFDVDHLQVATEGRYLLPAEPGTDLAAVMASTPISKQAVTLVAA